VHDGLDRLRTPAEGSTVDEVCGELRQRVVALLQRTRHPAGDP
jgi:hypothetical protein